MVSRARSTFGHVPRSIASGPRDIQRRNMQNRLHALPVAGDEKKGRSAGSCATSADIAAERSGPPSSPFTKSVSRSPCSAWAVAMAWSTSAIAGCLIQR
ncbi:MAG: hypothetical protein U0166_12145 [Acidobacteriota bacterium]